MQKFRPYFTSAELSEVISALKENPTPKRMPIIRYLETFNIKIERGVVSAGVELKGTKTDQLVKSLELDDNTSHINILNQLSKERERLYSAWRNGASLSPKELDLVNIYRYENDLMTSQEEKDYESQMILGKSK